MSNYLDYDELKHYTSKLLKKIAKLKDEVDFMNEKSDLVAKGLAKVTVSMKYSDGNPVPYAKIKGLYDSDSNAITAFTDEDGMVIAYIKSGSQTVSSNECVDISQASNTQAYVAGNRYTVNFTVNPVNYVLVTSTKNIYFTGNVSSVQYSLLGGGGGGSGLFGCSNDDSFSRGGSGGGDGYVVTGSTNVNSQTQYTVSVGTGGSGGSEAYANRDAIQAGTTSAANGKTGGSTTFQGVTASGGGGGQYAKGGTGSSGSGGAGANNRANARSGSSNYKSVFYSSFTNTEIVGGCGGGGGANQFIYTGYSENGGYPYGGTGGWYTTGDNPGNVSSKSGQKGGGGGGGISPYSGSYTKAGARGGSGMAAFRLQLLNGGG